MDQPYEEAGLFVLGADGRIDDDVACLHCGYNLRGLLPDGRCPECGTAIGRSMYGDFLRFCDPQWVGTLASGMNWIIAGIVIGLFGWAYLWFSGAAAGAFTPGGTNPLYTLAFWALSLIGLIGYWKVTTPDPSKLSEEMGWTARKLVRVTMVGGFLLTAAFMVVTDFDTVMGFVVQNISQLVGIVGMVAAFVYARQLAFRVPDKKLAGRTRFVMWGMVTVSVIGYLASTAFLIASPALMKAMAAGAPGGAGATAAASAPAGSGTATGGKATSAPATPASGPAISPAVGVGIMALGGLSCAYGLGNLIFVVLSISLLVRYRGRLSEAAQIAASTWARTPGTAVAEHDRFGG